MGIYDRDYYREAPRRRFGAFMPWSITTWLIVINIAVYVLDFVLQGMQLQPHGPFYLLGYFSYTAAIYHGQIWRFITFQFVHDRLWPIVGNMLGLYFFGPIVEGQFGPRRYLAFYLLCGMAGAAMYLLLLSLGILIGPAGDPMVGASAGIFGVLIAAAYLAPDMLLTLWLPFPMQFPLRVWAWVAVGVTALVVFGSGRHAGGDAAHLGGALLGFVLIRQPHLLNIFVTARRNAGGTAKRRRSKKRRVAFRDWSKDLNH